MIVIDAINLGREITVTTEDPETASIVIRQLLATGWCVCAHTETSSTKTTE